MENDTLPRIFNQIIIDFDCLPREDAAALTSAIEVFINRNHPEVALHGACISFDDSAFFNEVEIRTEQRRRPVLPQRISEEVGRAKYDHEELRDYAAQVPAIMNLLYPQSTCGVSQKIEAIKILRTDSGGTLKECKEAVEAVLSNLALQELRNKLMGN